MYRRVDEREDNPERELAGVIRKLATSPVADDCAAPTAMGVHAFGRRHVLDVSIKVSETESQPRLSGKPRRARGLQGADS